MRQGERAQLQAQAQQLLDAHSVDARALLETAKQLFVAGDPTLSRRLKRAPDTRFADALELLDRIGLREPGCDDPETLGQGGAIHKPV